MSGLNKFVTASISRILVKELFWIIVSSLLTILLFVYFFGTSGFQNERNYFEAYDESIGLSIKEFFLLFGSFIFIIIYLIRLIKNKFINRMISIIFIIACLVFLLSLSKVIAIFDYRLVVAETTEYNLPLPRKFIRNVLTFSYVVQAILYLLVVYTGHRTNFSK